MPKAKKAGKKPKKGSDTSANDTTDQEESTVTFKEPVTSQPDYDDESSSEESSEEDEDGVLLTDKVEQKIFQTLLKIKNKNPEIYAPEVKYFSDSDFEDEANEEDGESKKAKGLTYKDMVRETLLKEGAEGFENEEDDAEEPQDAQHGRTYQEEQEDLKKAFLSVADELDTDADFFKKSSATDVLPEPRFSNRKGAARNLGADSEGLISQYWAPEQPMNEEEEFLKDYILNQRWREDKKENYDYLKRLKVDQEDEDHLNEAEEFEYKYNYRFEEEGGAKIEGHPRNIEDSVRKVDERRKKKRQEKKQQKMEEKIRREEELKRLKNLKKAEIAERIREIEAKAGVKLDEDIVDLNAPFDPVQHEKDMKKILGKGYDKKDDDDWNPAHDCADEDEELWWLCDHCNKGIPVGAKHFDCTECDNYTLCEACVVLANHEHSRMVAKVVPPTCAPPKDATKAIAELEDEYYNLDYEDVIGDLKVRFKYRQVQPFKCDLQTILEKSDKELNAIMPLSKLLAYDAELPEKEMKVAKRKLEKMSKKSETSDGMDRRMTKYNVNRDRLQAFGLKEKKKAKKKKE
ncbi:zinc zz type domain-containing protein [Babesia ovata]|uniref:Zinc zz type domain-containing protein n=1 Tax=Babesia ovata TaxID=189622 RepID=A0A2H6KFV8_9APIC|nr:zinc zz type domain-containing protein [Babesia ovata]GBE61880.1 zinc zz type domain-containing protein [Babesia ovata]